MERVDGPSSPRSRPDLVGLVVGVVLLTGVAAFALAPIVVPRIDCARTPVEVSADTQGAPLARVRELVARDHATTPDRVRVAGNGADARELVVTDRGGDRRLTSVRVVRVADDGWVMATTNTCDDD